MKRYWQPLIPLRFDERDGKRILQQAWGVFAISDRTEKYEQTGRYEWRDVPMKGPETDDPKYWNQEVVDGQA